MTNQINIGDYVFHMIGATSPDGVITRDVICSRVTAIHEYEREDLPGRIVDVRYGLKHVDTGKMYTGEKQLLGACASDAVEKAIACLGKEIASLKEFLGEMMDQEPVPGQSGSNGPVE